jgi:hypothetical protein
VGRSGIGPYECDAAADLRGDVRTFLDSVLDPLRDGDPTDDELDLADDAARILGALGREGVDFRPSDAEDLAEQFGDELKPDAIEGLRAEPADARTALAGETQFVRVLREAGAPYRIWIGAAVLGEGARTIWEGARSSAEVIAAALGAGVPQPTLVRVIVEWVREQLGDRNTPFDARVRMVLETLVVGAPIDDRTREWLHEAMIRAVHASRAGAPDGRDLVIAIVEGLASGRLPWLPMRIAFVRAAIPDVTEQLRSRLEPHVVAALGSG